MNDQKLKTYCWLLIPGPVLFLLGLWGGAYILGALPPNHWAEFPAFTTATLLCIIGLTATIAGLVALGEVK